jgi:hypothetical protein
MTDEQFEELRKLCIEERARGLAGHHAYLKARHMNLYLAYVAERQRRDIEAIDKAFGRISEAAE